MFQTIGAYADRYSWVIGIALIAGAAFTLGFAETRGLLFLTMAERFLHLRHARH